MDIWLHTDKEWFVLDASGAYVDHEIRTIQKDNLAAGLDVVASYFSFKATSPRTWIPEHWKPRRF